MTLVKILLSCVCLCVYGVYSLAVKPRGNWYLFNEYICFHHWHALICVDCYKLQQWKLVFLFMARCVSVEEQLSIDF